MLTGMWVVNSYIISFEANQGARMAGEGVPPESPASTVSIGGK